MVIVSSPTVLRKRAAGRKCETRSIGWPVAVEEMLNLLLAQDGLGRLWPASGEMYLQTHN